MTQYVVRRLILAVPVLLGVSIIIFLMIHLAPGDPVRIMLGLEATSESVARLTHQLGLDRPLPVQYLRWISGAVRGDLGQSIRTGRPVIVEISDRFMATALLALTGMSLAVAVGIIAGVTAGANRGTWVDRLVMILATIGVSTPSFWLGLLLILLFCVHLRWLPIASRVSPQALVLPATSLGVLAATVIARLTRANMVEVLSSDYIRTAEAKGLSGRVVLYKHALRNALIPVITIVGIQVASLLGGTFVIEQVFAWPGLGTLAVNAIRSRDFPLIQAIVLFVASSYVFVNLLVDVTYAVLDPRIKYR